MILYYSNFNFIINLLKIHLYYLFFHPTNSLIDAAILVLQYSSNYKLNNNSMNEVPSCRPDSTKSLSHRLPSQRPWYFRRSVFRPITRTIFRLKKQ